MRTLSSPAVARVAAALVLGVMATLMCLLFTPNASAAIYTVHSCRLPGGQEAGLQKAVGGGPGWSYVGVTNGSSSDPSPCSSPGEDITMGPTGNFTDNSTWSFKAPPTTPLVGFRAQRGFVRNGGVPVYSAYANASATQTGSPMESCSSSSSCFVLAGSTLSRANLINVFNLHFDQTCQNAGDCPGGSTSSVSRVELDLDDSNAPAGSANGLSNLAGSKGALAQQVIAVPGQDVGAGLQTAYLLLNGNRVTAQPFSGQTANCTDVVPGNNAHDYVVFRPCPDQGTSTLTIDPNTLGLGTYTVQVILRDGAGNETLLGQSATWQVNGPPPVCSDASDNDSDGRIDAADPGCHTDGNPNNPLTYDPNDTDESDPQGPPAPPAPPAIPACADGGDNDGDGLADRLDPGCLTGPGGTYNPAGNSELTQCQDQVDNDGDKLTDTRDPRCHSDRNSKNAGSYDPHINTELAACQDGRDNDGDKKADRKDPGCYTGGTLTGSYIPNDDDERDSNICQGAIRTLYWQVEKRKSIRSKIVINGKSRAYAVKGLRVVFRGTVTGCKAGSTVRVTATLPNGTKVQKTGLKVRSGGRITGFAEQSAGSRRITVRAKNAKTLRFTRTSRPSAYR